MLSAAGLAWRGSRDGRLSPWARPRVEAPTTHELNPLWPPNLEQHSDFSPHYSTAQGANVLFRYCDFSKNVAGQGAGVAVYNQVCARAGRRAGSGRWAGALLLSSATAGPLASRHAVCRLLRVLLRGSPSVPCTEQLGTATRAAAAQRSSAPAAPPLASPRRPD